MCLKFIGNKNQRYAVIFRSLFGLGGYAKRYLEAQDKEDIHICNAIGYVSFHVLMDNESC